MVSVSETRDDATVKQNLNGSYQVFKNGNQRIERLEILPFLLFIFVGISMCNTIHGGQWKVRFSVIFIFG